MRRRRGSQSKGAPRRLRPAPNRRGRALRHNPRMGTCGERKQGLSYGCWLASDRIAVAQSPCLRLWFAALLAAPIAPALHRANWRSCRCFLNCHKQAFSAIRSISGKPRKDQKSTGNSPLKAETRVVRRPSLVSFAERNPTRSIGGDRRARARPSNRFPSPAGLGHLEAMRAQQVRQPEKLGCVTVMTMGTC